MDLSARSLPASKTVIPFGLTPTRYSSLTPERVGSFLSSSDLRACTPSTVSASTPNLISPQESTNSLFMSLMPLSGSSKNFRRSSIENISPCRLTIPSTKEGVHGTGTISVAGQTSFRYADSNANLSPPSVKTTACMPSCSCSSLGGAANEAALFFSMPLAPSAAAPARASSALRSLSFTLSQSIRPFFSSAIYRSLEHRSYYLFEPPGHHTIGFREKVVVFFSFQKFVRRPDMHLRLSAAPACSKELTQHEVGYHEILVKVQGLFEVLYRFRAPGLLLPYRGKQYVRGLVERVCRLRSFAPPGSLFEPPHISIRPGKKQQSVLAPVFVRKGLKAACGFIIKPLDEKLIGLGQKVPPGIIRLRRGLRYFRLRHLGQRRGFFYRLQSLFCLNQGAVVLRHRPGRPLRSAG